MKIPFNDLTAGYPDYLEEAMARIRHLIEHSRFVGGKEIELFEEEFAAYCGTAYAVGCANGTDALVVALKALGIGPGDTVVTVPATFIASAEAIEAVGAKVAFVDIDPDRFTMDPSALQSYLDSPAGTAVKAVIPVHLYGQMADMASISAIARKKGLRIVEDAAQAHGATVDGKGPGYYGDIATFSFYPGKNLGAFGDAGAAVTNNPALRETMKMLANHGRWKEKYTHSIVGYNARLDTIQAAILRVKLRQLPLWTEKRVRLAAEYTTALAGKKVQVPFVAEGSKPVFHLYVIQSGARDELQERLAAAEIETGVHYPIPLHLQPAFSHLGYREGDFPVSENSSKRVLSLPLWPEQTDAQLARVCSLI